MVTTLQQQLIAAKTEGLFNLGFVLLHGGNVCFFMTRDSVKITEFTVCNTHIGSIHIPVDDPCDNLFGLPLPSHSISNMH
ncbi:MAG: hypothetical protein BWY67_01193 [Bacteroidetes bacterium ADurb.Bin397]|nr:MAG: hypothetical protein BWY67_01193 [Bacteroidetes bacterium ADurb.Bin397]